MGYCSVQQLETEGLEKAKSIFKGNSQNVTFDGNVATITWGKGNRIITRSNAYNFIHSKVGEIENWAEKEFGNSRKWMEGWASWGDPKIDSFQVNFHVPIPLLEAYKVKFKNQTLEEANAKITPQPEGIISKAF